MRMNKNTKQHFNRGALIPMLKQRIFSLNCHKTVGLIGDSCAYLDHIAPICGLINIPLITNSLQTKLLCSQYYPGLNCLFNTISFQELIQNFDTLIYPFKWDPLFYHSFENLRQTDLYNPLYSKKMKLIYTTHGSSDKGYKSETLCFHPHLDEIDLLLTNGSRMLDIFRFHKRNEHIKKIVLTGNIRHAYYQLHKAFYDVFVEKEIFSYFTKKQTTILYAPSVHDTESSSSLLEAHSYIIETLPKDYNLIVKLHPLIFMKPDDKNARLTKQLIEKYAGNKQILFIINCPIVYALLNRVDVYLGDHSSVGYDALTFDIPLYFINHNRYDEQDLSAFLHQCGRTFLPDDWNNIYSLIENNLENDKRNYQDKRMATYEYAYGTNNDPKTLNEKLKRNIESLP